MKKWIIITGLSVLAIACGAGCKSLPGKLEVDTPFFDIEYKDAVKE